MIKPWELQEAELIDGLCQRYSCLPSALLAEEATILKMVAIVQEGQPEDDGKRG